MKEKISMLRLKTFLSPKEMKNITGGSGINGCYWESRTDSGCVPTEVQAEFMACGGYWCCNCADSYACARCGPCN